MKRSEIECERINIKPHYQNKTRTAALTLTTQNPPKGTFFEKKSALLETGTFTSSNGAKLRPGKKYKP